MPEEPIGPATGPGRGARSPCYMPGQAVPIYPAIRSRAAGPLTN